MIRESTFGAGCFWCIEACFLDLKGVLEVYPGYCGGHTINPTYEEVCRGTTGHAEVARVMYDDTVISYEDLLKVFWFVHDPTQLNRQGYDIGPQYRSVIFYHDDLQKEHALSFKQRLDDEKVWDKPIVTEIREVSTFYPAEEYHHNYFKNNPENMYCLGVVRPKVQKFRKVFDDLLKK